MPPFDFDPRNDGFWGDTTSTLDWCENNYEVKPSKLLTTLIIMFSLAGTSLSSTTP